MPKDVVLYVKNCVIGYRCTNSSNVLRKIIISFPVMKQPPVSASAAEAVTNFKIAFYMYEAI